MDLALPSENLLRTTGLTPCQQNKLLQPHWSVRLSVLCLASSSAPSYVYLHISYPPKHVDMKPKTSVCNL